MKIKLGLVKGRHEIPEVKDYVYEGELDPTDTITARRIAEIKLSLFSKEDTIYLFVTGLTMALVSVINACKTKGIKLVLMHYDRETNSYFPQEVEWTTLSLALFRLEKSRSFALNKELSR